MICPPNSRYRTCSSRQGYGSLRRIVFRRFPTDSLIALPIVWPYYPFPKDAVREALFNALIHQDFSTSIPVQISVYRDRLYISNDCVFPENWTAETLMQKHRSLPHNPDIANTFYRTGYIESWGRGIEKICELCHDYDIPTPEFTVNGADIMMKFTTASGPNSGPNGPNDTNRATQLRNLSNRKCAILRCVADNESITLDELAQECNVGRTTIKRDIAELQQLGLLVREGGTRGRWVVKMEDK